MDCPGCAAPAAEPFFALSGLPVHGTEVLADAAAARAVPRGDQHLCLCPRCGVVFNRAFDPALLDYGGAHAESQHHSPRFAAYAAELAGRWVREFGLAGRTVVEVGCGAGEFLAELVWAGAGRGIGVDPHYHRPPAALADRITAVPRFFSAADVPPDTAALVCRHTLEHVPAALGFGAELVAGLRRAGGTGPLLAEVPDLTRVLAEGAFWDLEYEHCTYFAAAPLAGFLGRVGFGGVRTYRTYADQYLVAEVHLADAPEPAVPAAALDELADACARFDEAVTGQLARWREHLAAQSAAGRPVVVWGGGAKGLMFLNVLGGSVVDPGVESVVDINPGLQGRWIGGLGLPIRAPGDLPGVGPAQVVLMNPVYTGEVRGMLDELGLASTELLTL